MNLSPAEGLSLNPVISTGVLGPASTIFSPKSFLNVLTPPWVVPTTIGSPSLNVPFWINSVATPPMALSTLDSITVPTAYLLGFAFNSRTSLIASNVSRSVSIPSPVLQEIFTNGISPPQISGVILFSAISVSILSGFASGLSILFTATTIGTLAAKAWSIASLVWGITPSSAATIIITISVILAPLARISVNAACPGVSIKVILLSLYSIW